MKIFFSILIFYIILIQCVVSYAYPRWKRPSHHDYRDDDNSDVDNYDVDEYNPRGSRRPYSRYYRDDDDDDENDDDGDDEYRWRRPNRYSRFKKPHFNGDGNRFGNDIRRENERPHFNNYGYLGGQGEFNNIGSVNNYDRIYNDGEFNNAGGLNNYDNIHNEGEFNNYGDNVDIHGSIRNTGVFTNYADGPITSNIENYGNKLTIHGDARYLPDNIQLYGNADVYIDAGP